MPIPGFRRTAEDLVHARSVATRGRRTAGTVGAAVQSSLNRPVTSAARAAPINRAANMRNALASYGTAGRNSPVATRTSAAVNRNVRRARPVNNAIRTDHSIANQTAANIRRNVNRGVQAAPPPKAASRFARHGKMVAAGVAAAGGAAMYARNRSGRPMDPVQGRPRGLFNY